MQQLKRFVQKSIKFLTKLHEFHFNFYCYWNWKQVKEMGTSFGNRQKVDNTNQTTWEKNVFFFLLCFHDQNFSCFRLF